MATLDRTDSPLTRQPDARPPARTVLASAVVCEWRLIRGDFAWWCAVLACIACMAYAASNGRNHVGLRQKAVDEAFKAEAARVEALKGTLGKIERGEMPPPAAPYRDPRNAIYVGRGQGATVAHLPDAPLAAAAVGLSDLYPQVIEVSASSKDSFLFADEIANPVHGLAGTFDMAFVVAYLLPLMILAVGYDVVSSERERGTLAMTAATSAPLAAVLAGKMAIRTGGVALGAVLAFWGTLVIGGGSIVDRLPAALGMTLAILATWAFWAAVCLFVNSLGRDSAANAVMLVILWVALVVIGPAFANAAASLVYPAPARSELVLAVREASVGAERDLDAAEARFREEHAGTSELRRDDRTARTLEVTVAADARADELLARQEIVIRQQRRMAERLSMPLPSSLVYDTIAELAGSGHSRWDDYLARVADFHERWRQFFVKKARAGAMLTSADYAAFPRFEAVKASPATRRATLQRVTGSLGLIAAMSAVLATLALLRLGRSEI